MPKLYLPDGTVIDADTSEIIQRGGSAGGGRPTDQGPKQTVKALGGREAAGDVATEGMDRVLGAINQLSWGFNAALFALPDAYVKTVGKAIGLDPKETIQFTRFFNTGEVAPRNAEERLARAVGSGAGEALPFTGILGVVAKGKTLTAPLTADAGAIKRIAKDTLDFIRARPKEAVALDLATGGIYRGAEQVIGEAFPESSGAVREAGALGAAFTAPGVVRFGEKVLGLAGKLPGVSAARAVIKGESPIDAVNQSLAPITGETGFIARQLEKRGEKQVRQMLEPLQPYSPETTPAIQQELARGRALQEQMGLQLLPGEMALEPRLLAAQAMVAERLTGQPLLQEQARRALNEEALRKAFGAEFDQATPNFQQQLLDTMTKSQKMIDDLAVQKETLTAQEAQRVGNLIPVADFDLLGNELRAAVNTRLNIRQQDLRQAAEDAGLRIGFSDEGLRLPTIGKDGKALFPAINAEGWARGVAREFSENEFRRLFGNTFDIAPVAGLRKALFNYDTRIESLVNKQGAEFAVEEARRILKSNLPANTYKQLKDGDFKKFADELLSYAKDSSAKTPMAKALMPKMQGEELMRNAKNVLEDAKRGVREANPFEISFPDAVDLMNMALRSRARVGERMAKLSGQGPEGAMKATAAEDKVNAFYTRMEDLFSRFDEKFGADIMGQGMGQAQQNLYNAYRRHITDAFFNSRIAPVVERTAAGEALNSNEKIARSLLKDAESLRAAKNVFGENNESFNDILRTAVLDTIRQRKVISDNGILQPQKLQNVIDSFRSKGLYKELPEQIRTLLDDQARLANDYQQRLVQVTDRMEELKANQLTKVLGKFADPQADMGQLVEKALTDPVLMGKIKGALTTDQEQSFRKLIWDNISEKALTRQTPMPAEELRQYEASLRQIMSPEHLARLEKLSAAVNRVFATPAPTGRLNAARTSDEKIRESFGISPESLESRFRAAAEGRISTDYAILSMATRIISASQKAAFGRAFQRSMMDPNFAKSFDQYMTSQNPSGVFRKAGSLFQRFMYAAGIEGAKVSTMNAIEAFTDLRDREVPRDTRPMQGLSLPLVPAQIPVGPQAPRTPAQPMPQAPAPAPQSSLANINVAAAPAQGGPQARQQYAALFPYDPISPLMRS